MNDLILLLNRDLPIVVIDDIFEYHNPYRQLYNLVLNELTIFFYIDGITEDIKRIKQLYEECEDLDVIIPKKKLHLFLIDQILDI